MARPPDPIRRQELLDRAVDYIVAHGISDLTLRPLAEAIGTQAPVLLHHFGSKEHLVEELLGQVRDRVRARGRAAEAENYRSGLGTVWTWVSDPAQGPIMRLFFEAYGLALRDPDRYSGFLQHAVRDWLDEPLAAVDDISATLAIATITGLLLDLLTTGESARVDEAMKRFTAMLHWDAESGHVRAVTASEPGSDSARGHGAGRPSM